MTCTAHLAITVFSPDLGSFWEKQTEQKIKLTITWRQERDVYFSLYCVCLYVYEVCGKYLVLAIFPVKRPNLG